jgi:hypothetical protein
MEILFFFNSLSSISLPREIACSWPFCLSHRLIFDFALAVLTIFSQSLLGD